MNDSEHYRLYIFDVDGTLRWTTVPGQQCPLAPNQWQLMPGVAERLRAIPWHRTGPWLAVASNQSAVGAGLITDANARAMINSALVAAVGRVPDRTRIELCTCPEHVCCDCRKPAPELLLRHLRHYGVPPQQALFVGDLPIDREAASRAGIAFMWAHDFFARAEERTSPSGHR